ncbi:hypothetical protein ASD21_20280 [Caulobacter sp. Root1455]|uniref:hypothetical protein n=1 Tax=Caulobacter sp. Root1455 TaxID=1736465 RepID=UPI00070200AF|nr:hypothetical protein [Caulobacter sp. Root1455]KQZ03622.1 hypothetical protein ASD21_20280 [Caulobacter sp. Root1455]
MRKFYLAVAMAAAATPVCATDLAKSSDGYTYFNKPGAQVAVHDADVRDCKVKAGRLYQPDTSAPVYAPGLAGAIGVAIAKAIAQAVANAKARPVNVENCMVVKGWRVVALDPVAGEAASKLEATAKLARMTPLIGAAEPEGTVVRVFANDAASNQTAGMFSPARNTIKAALSVEAMGDPPESDKPVKEKAAPAPKLAKSARPPAPLKADQLGEIPANSALIVVNVQGTGAFSVTFEREGPDAKTPAWADGRPGSFLAAQPVKATATAGGAQGTTLVFAVPPGRWKIDHLSAGLFTVSLCLGAPSFEVAAGDVVYAGSFDPASATNNIGPEMTLEPYRAVFPALSGLGEKMRPASYVNGSTGQCQGAYMYALETVGRPFAEGYALGSKAQPAPTASAVAAPAPDAAIPASTPAAPAAPAATPTSAPAAAAPAASAPAAS